MPRMLKWTLRRAGGLAIMGCLFGCNSVIGLDKFSVKADGGSSNAGGSTSTGGSDSSGGSGGIAGTSTTLPDASSNCSTNAECTEQATAAAAASAAGSDAGSGTAPATVPAICLRSEGHCVTLVSGDCSTITGDYLNDKAIIIGSLFATQGTTATQNIPRQQSALLAIEEVNNSGGIPTNVAGDSRPLVMVSCDTSANMLRAATHLVSDIHVPAIVGPNTSQDTLDVSNKVTILANVLVVSPTAVAASIGDLVDKDLTWLMIPSDNQRAQLMMKNISEVETNLRAQRNLTNVKLSIIYRDDALGVGTRTSMDALVINGKLLSDPINLGTNVHIDHYDPKQPDYASIITAETAFAPDIVVLAGTAETVTKVMTPLELAWTGSNRPYYFLIDPSKGPELLAAVTGNDDLRLRVRGSGTKPGADSVPVANTFSTDFYSRYAASPTASGTGPSYDAVYAIAYALAATKDLPVSGPNIAQGLRKLAGGATSIATGTADLLLAFQNLASGQNITGVGTYCPLEWDKNGVVMGGTIEMWCIGTSGTTAVFQSSGLTFDIKTQAVSGSYAQCGP